MRPQAERKGRIRGQRQSSRTPSAYPGGKLKVLELSQAVAGPTVTQILADYGADVIKVERPGSGDIFRDVPGMGPSMFLAVNRGKKSIAIDLRTRKGLKLLYELMKWCDVFVENLSPGASERMGVSYARARRLNKGVIFCSVESFGAGPMEDVPAFDPVLQAATGIMSTTGFPPDRFARAGISIVDMSTGMHAAIAIMQMLLDREKTGRGGRIEVSLYDSAAYFMSYWVTRLDLSGRDTAPLGSTHIFGAPYNLFRTSDGWVYIAVAGDSDWDSFCNALEFADLHSREEYRTREDRVRNKTTLESIIGSRISRMKTGEVCRKLKKWRVPSSALNTAKSLLSDPHFRSRGLLLTYHLASAEGGERTYHSIVNPAVINGRRVYASKSPPKLGGDTESILMDIVGLSAKEISALEREKVIECG